MFGNGDRREVIDGFKENVTERNSLDYRFTTKGNNVCTFMMRTPENRKTVIKRMTEQENVTSLSLFGAVQTEALMAGNSGILIL